MCRELYNLDAMQVHSVTSSHMSVRFEDIEGYGQQELDKKLTREFQLTPALGLSKIGLQSKACSCKARQEKLVQIGRLLLECKAHFEVCEEPGLRNMT